MTTILFLDVDGVLNCRTTWSLKDGQKGTQRICPDRVKLLSDLLDTTGAMVVLSSTWREYDDHIAYLWKRAPSVTCRLHDDWRTKRITNEIEDSTGRLFLSGVPRGSEIAEWLSRHPEIAIYAIVDDDGDMLPGQRPYFVQTDFDNGLTADHTSRLSRILGADKQGEPQEGAP